MWLPGSSRPFRFPSAHTRARPVKKLFAQLASLCHEAHEQSGKGERTNSLCVFDRAKLI